MSDEEFLNALINHKEPECPKCHKGKIYCPVGKIESPHFFVCSENCGYYINIDYNTPVVE